MQLLCFQILAALYQPLTKALQLLQELMAMQQQFSRAWQCQWWWRLAVLTLQKLPCQYCLWLLAMMKLLSVMKLLKVLTIMEQVLTIMELQSKLQTQLQTQLQSQLKTQLHTQLKTQLIRAGPAVVNHQPTMP